MTFPISLHSLSSVKFKQIAKFVVIGILFIANIFNLLASKNNSELCIQWVMPELHPESDFQPIQEFFTCQEKQGRDAVVRTDPVCRGGMYFVVMLNQPVRCLGSSAKVILRYILSDCPQKQERIFNIPTDCVTSKSIYVGLTGQDWPACDLSIVAWCVEVIDSNGCSVSEESYLWRYKCE